MNQDAAGPGTTARWTDLPQELNPELEADRRLLHWAVQLPAAAADALLPEAPDDSHTNVFWDPGLATLVGRPLGYGSGVRVAVSPGDLSVRLLSGVGREGGHPAATAGAEGTADPAFVLHLAGLTLHDAAARLGAALSDRLGRSVDLQFRDYDMPDHPVGSGDPFPSPPTLALSELATWYALGTAALMDLAEGDERTVPVAIWPHHFDIGTIVFLDGVPGGTADWPPDEESVDARKKAPQIGLGLSPGDGSIPHPYFYVTPWPVDRWDDLPALPHGRWQTEGFQGAVLDAHAILSVPGAARQSAVEGFLRNALTHGERLVRRSGG